MIPLEASIGLIPVDGPRAGSASVIQRKPIFVLVSTLNVELDFNHQPVYNPCIRLCAIKRTIQNHQGICRSSDALRSRVTVHR